MKDIIKKNWIFLIPVVFFFLGIAYARSVEAFVGIGIVVMTIIGTVALLSGTLTYRLTEKLLLSILVTGGVFVIVFGIIILLVRTGI